MLQKMYKENIDELGNLRSKGEGSEGPESKKLDFSFYWNALIKNKWPITLFTAAVTALALYYSQVATPIYASSSTLLLESQRANIISIEDLVSSEQESLDYFGTQYAILKSRGLAERVIRRLELDENVSQSLFVDMLAPSTTDVIIGNISQAVESGYNTVLSKLGLSTNNATVDTQSSVSTTTASTDTSANLATITEDERFNEILKHFRKSLSINPVPKTKLVSIVYESPEPKFSAMAANAVAEEYIDSVLDRREALKEEASIWMNGRIAELKVKLDESEDALISFKKANGLIELGGGVGQLNEQELLLTSTELAAARNELSNAGDLFRKIQTFKNSTPELLETLPIIQNDLLVRSVKTELGQVQRDLVESRNRYGEKHPRIVDTESRLESLRSTLDGHIARIVATFENDYQLLQQRVASLQSNVVRGKENIQAIGQQKITLEALEREVTANRDQYNRLFDRITETRTTDGLDEANAVVAELAWVPLNPIKPKKTFIVGAALIASLMIAAAIAFLVEFLDDTVNNTADIETRLKSRLLGVLPLVEPGFMRRRTAHPLTPLDVIETSETYAEAVNTCRTALTISPEKELQVILVTSSVPNEGKSTVALNLAYSFGKMERTLLIDCDLRRPSIANSLGMSDNDIGLSSLLLRQSSVEESFKLNVLDAFDCLTSGPLPDQPLEMLSSAKFAKLLDKLRQSYDKIIIDSAPTHIVSDALVLSKLADGVLYVVKPHDTSIKLVDSGLTRLADARATVAGVCVSQVDISKPKSNGGFEFHGFGVDYHGYGNYYKQGKTTPKPSKPNLRAVGT